MFVSPFVLGSASERRRDLLASIGVTPLHIVVADIDETAYKREKPHHLAIRLASSKAHKVAHHHPDLPVLAADTIAILGQNVLGKPKNEDQARLYLSNMSGRRHRIFTALSLLMPDGREIKRHSSTIVGFKRLELSEIEAFIQTEEWKGKSGGYAMQGHAAGFIRLMRGSWSNVVGLPLFEARQILRSEKLTPF